LLDQLLGYFRDMMAAAVGCPADAFLHVSMAEQPIVTSAAAQLGLETILAILQILDQTISRLKYLMQPRTVAELALVRICNLQDLDALPQLISSLREGAALSGSELQAAAAPSKKKFEPPVAAQIINNGNGHLAHRPSNGLADGDGQRQVESSVASAEARATAVTRPASDLSPENVFALWQQAAAQLGGLAAEKAQQATAAAILNANQLVITFPKRYNFCRQFCERPEVTAQLSETISRLVQRNLIVTFELAEEAPVPVREATPLTQRQKIHQACQRPLVKKAIELFDANPVRMEEAV